MRTAPLSRRILLVTLAGGVVVALVALVLTVPVVTGVARDQAREELVRSVDSLAAKPAAAARLIAQEQKVLGRDDRRYAIVRRGGNVTGAAGDLLTDEQVAELLSTGTLSATSTVDGETILIEGRETRRGFSAVAVQPVTGVDEATSALRRRLLLALLLGIAAAGTLGLVLSRTLTRSVAAAAGAARRLAAGERGVPIGTSSVREFDDMGNAVATLDEALATSEGRQREFLLSISHEIRTPLTALRGYAEALADGAVAPADVPATGETLVAETARLDRFVSDLLALARLEADDFTIEAQDVSVAGLLDDLQQAWQVTCEREGVTLLAVTGPATVRADPMRLRQLLDGLVENAVRATPAGGVVEVRTVSTVTELTIVVTDTGPGIDPADLSDVFERGVLHARYRDVRAVGTGLGLSIAHRLATRMGMRIESRNGVDRGSEFAVVVPIR
ncbi:sensor histidine kinase [Aeromicrobium ginsengisoli]|uniref:histidine kinase n=1 Tax=Aeromicrobium ginsengisoli TaxID=363867 RepID=A0A5M4FDN8_9ACTN|nr:HAMP domain-containing sensor histidine kinase [Aeromicrobium ginsengisoli]KAA1397276.1 HAMP domain-containing histidine kinase [Aeromicrobium ginsengisoli]